MYFLILHEVITILYTNTHYTPDTYLSHPKDLCLEEDKSTLIEVILTLPLRLGKGGAMSVLN